MEDPKNMRLKIDRTNHAAYDRAFRDYSESLRTYCHSRGAEFVTVSTEYPLEEMMFKELLKVGIMA